MIRLLVRRLIATIPLLFLVTLIVWALLLLVPGDPAFTIAGENATPAQVETVRDELGLNDPAVVQYGRWLGDAVQGDLGTSLFNSYAVVDAIVDRLPVTISLLSLAFVLSLIIGIPAGVIAATRRGSAIDRLLTIGTSIGIAAPNFWLGLVLIAYVSGQLGWFPSGGYVGLADDPLRWLHHLFLPALTLAFAAAAELARQMRAGMIDVLDQDFIRTHRAKGLPRRLVVGRYALKNAMVPVVTVAGLQVARLFGLSAIVERIFGMDGVGELAVTSVLNRDIPIIQGVVLFVTLLVVAANLLVDVSYGYFNPKVRLR